MNEIEFYINNFSFLNKNDVPDLSFMPMLQRRKLSNVNRAAFYTLNNCYDDSIENIIYSSENGELERLDVLIKQYQENNEVSPSAFSSSVHNSSVGSFALFKQYNKNYTALSSCNNSFSMGLLNAIIDKSNNKLYCYADTTNEINSICINISKYKNQNSKKYILKQNQNKDVSSLNEAKAFINLLMGNCNTINYSIYTVERMEND